MSESMNPRTGLRESFDERLELPLVHQRSVAELCFDGQITGLHTVALERGLSLDFYARLPESEEIVVTFHGANHSEKNIYPMFARIRSLGNKAKSMMAFADPTIKADPHRQMLLSWYLGGPGWDPLPLILRAVREAQAKTGANHVAFLGGSGGGFAALRASAMTPGSMAFVQEPQTNIGEYHLKTVDRYFRTVWPNWNQKDLIEAFPERFNMVRHYASANPKNFVYYVQSDRARMHLAKHYSPFKEAHNVLEPGGVSANRNRSFVLYRGKVAGHGKITASEFDQHYLEAMNAWRVHRAR